MYRQMEIDTCIAHNIESYVDIAYRLGHNETFHRSVVSEIHEKWPSLDTNRKAAVEWKDLILNLLK